MSSKATKKEKTSTQRKNKGDKTKTSSNYQVIYLLIGLITSFFAIIGLFNWGFFGLLIANAFRLFVGEAYTLLLLAFLYLGLIMSLSGKIFNVRLKQLFGFILLITAIATLLHFNEFYDQALMYDSIYEETFNLFRNELLTNQNRMNLGGGILGAVCYSAFAYLFGQWGSYVLIGIIFFIGLFMLVGATINAFQLACRDIWQGIKALFSKLQPNYEKIKSIFQRVNEDDSNYKPAIDKKIEQANQPIEAEEDLNKENAHEQTPQTEQEFSRKLTKPSTWFKRAHKENQKEIYDPLTHHYQPSIPITEKPDFELFNEGTPFAKTAAESREEFLEGKTLDLDYFDYINQTNENSVETKHKSENKIENSETVKIHTANNNNINDNEKNDEKTVIKIDNGATNNVSPDLSEESETNNPNNKEIVEVSENTSDTSFIESESSPSHWMDMANLHQALTDDELDIALAESDLEDKQSTKKLNTAKRKNKAYQLPGKNLLKKIPPVDQSEEYKRINENIEKLEKTFESFGVNAKVVKANLGPSVTKYEIEPAIGVKVSKIVSLTDDIALALAARDVRMEAPIPGKSLIGIEVPNMQVSPVSFWEIIDVALDSPNLLEVPLGRDISGTVCLADLSKMPHLLIAGATGSGKSVGMNVIIVSLLMKAKPEEVKLLMIDPKKVELTMYNDIPHLLSPVVTNPRKAAQALNKVVQEMERRYELFAMSGVRNIDSYNENIDQWSKEDGTALEALPKIVVFIDELADLMMVASNDVENAIIRLAQMARAAGIHMIIATQRPSVDVITGIIKANVPSRLAFAVSSGTDSRTILDSVGAEKLLGRGDMLFQPMGKNKPIRVQGAYISDHEVERITDFIKAQRDADYDENMIVTEENLATANASDDEYYEEAVEMLYGLETVSISQLQRKFRIGYNRAARLVDDLEAQGLVSEQDGSKPRQVLVGQVSLED